MTKLKCKMKYYTQIKNYKSQINSDVKIQNSELATSVLSLEFILILTF